MVWPTERQRRYAAKETSCGAHPRREWRSPHCSIVVVAAEIREMDAACFIHLPIGKQRRIIHIDDELRCGSIGTTIFFITTKTKAIGTDIRFRRSPTKTIDDRREVGVYGEITARERGTRRKIAVDDFDGWRAQATIRLLDIVLGVAGGNEERNRLIDDADGLRALERQRQRRNDDGRIFLWRQDRGLELERKWKPASHDQYDDRDADNRQDGQERESRMMVGRHGGVKASTENPLITVEKSVARPNDNSRNTRRGRKCWRHRIARRLRSRRCRTPPVAEKRMRMMPVLHRTCQHVPRL